MLNNISTLESIEKMANSVQEYLEITVSDNPEEIVERGNDLTVYLAQTSKLLADAKYHLNTSKKASIILHAKKKLSPTIFKELINSSTERETYFVNWIERLNRACTHELDWLRSVLSKMKEEMRMQGYQKG